MRTFMKDLEEIYVEEIDEVYVVFINSDGYYQFSPKSRNGRLDYEYSSTNGSYEETKEAIAAYLLIKGVVARQVGENH